MQKVNIEILRAAGPFHDTIQGNKYPAFIYDEGEIVPAPWSRPWDDGPEKFKVIAFIDDNGDDVLQSYDATVHNFFTVVDEEGEVETPTPAIQMYMGYDVFDGTMSMFAVKVGTRQVAIAFADGEHWMTEESFGNPEQWGFVSRDLFDHLDKSLSKAKLVWETQA